MRSFQMLTSKGEVKLELTLDAFSKRGKRVLSLTVKYGGITLDVEEVQHVRDILDGWLTENILQEV